MLEVASSSQGDTQISLILPLGTMNAYTKYYDSPYISCLDISVWTQVIYQTKQLANNAASLYRAPKAGVGK